MRPKPFERMCCCCRVLMPKSKMIRLIKQNGEIKVDKTLSLGGKGIYVCQDCAKDLEKNKVLNKAFKCNVSSDVYKKIYDELKEF